MMDHVLENEERADAIILWAADSVWRSVKVTMRRSVGSCEDVEAIKGPGVVMGTYLVSKWCARVTGSVSCAKAKATLTFRSFGQSCCALRLQLYVTLSRTQVVAKVVAYSRACSSID